DASQNTRLSEWRRVSPGQRRYACVAREWSHVSRGEEIVGPEALGEGPRRQDLDAVIGPPRTLIQAHDDSFADPGVVCRERSQTLQMVRVDRARRLRLDRRAQVVDDEVHLDP